MNSRNGPGVFGNLLLLTVVWLALARAGAAEVRLVGSDLLGHELLTAVHAFVGREKLTLTVTLDGSRSGLELLKSRRAQVGCSRCRPKKSRNRRFSHRCRSRGTAWWWSRPPRIPSSA